MAVIVKRTHFKPRPTAAYQEGATSVSLCMIVKNEERFLPRALETLQPIVDEMIIADTGSTDGTLEIAKQFGAKIVHFKWIDDFSKARNFCISHATKAWILTLDADERISAADYEEFRSLLNARGTCWEFAERHYTNDTQFSDFRTCKKEYPTEEEKWAGYFESGRVRLFPNDRAIQFKGAVHELVEPTIRMILDYEIRRSRIPIHHYGHTVRRERQPKKSTLYMKAGVEKATTDPTDWKNFYELGVEYNNNRMLELSYEQFKKAAQLNPSYVPIWTNMGYVLCELGRYDESLKCLNHAIRLDPQSAEAFGNLGVVYLRTQNAALAVPMLIKAVQLNPDFVTAYCNLGNGFARLGRTKEAIEAYEHAIKLHAQCATAKAELGALMITLNELDRAEELLTGAIDDNPEYVGGYYNLGLLYQIKGNPRRALEAFSGFLSRAGENPLKSRVERACEMLRTKAG